MHLKYLLVINNHLLAVNYHIPSKSAFIGGKLKSLPLAYNIIDDYLFAKSKSKKLISKRNVFKLFWSVNNSKFLYGIQKLLDDNFTITQTSSFNRLLR